MVQLTADATMPVASLGQFLEPVEIYDVKGKLLGLFVPADLGRGKQIHAQVEAHLDRAELERRQSYTGKWYTMREVFEHLKSLTQDSAEQAYLQQKIDRLAEEEACGTP